MEYQNYPSMISYCTIQSFDHATCQIDHGYGIMSSLNIYPCVTWFDDDDSVDELIETLSNIHPYSDQRLSKSSSYETT